MQLVQCGKLNIRKKGLNSVTGSQIVINNSSLNRAADLFSTAFAAKIPLNVLDSNFMSLNVRIDAMDYQASNDHKNDQGGKDDQRYIQARSKCLGKY